MLQIPVETHRDINPTVAPDNHLSVAAVKLKEILVRLHQFGLKLFDAPLSIRSNS